MHGDLGTRDVLVGRQGLCKLTGFGEQPIVFDKDTYATTKKVNINKIQMTTLILINYRDPA